MKYLKFITKAAGIYSGGVEYHEPLDNLLNIQDTSIDCINGMAVTFLRPHETASVWVFTDFVTVVDVPSVSAASLINRPYSNAKFQ